MMVQWQKSFTREPPKTKAELRAMLARNTQPEPKRQSMSKKRSPLQPQISQLR
jgi:hypothetical protein